jgi:hypothetical protein
MHGSYLRLQVQNRNEQSNLDGCHDHSDRNDIHTSSLEGSTIDTSVLLADRGDRVANDSGIVLPAVRKIVQGMSAPKDGDHVEDAGQYGIEQTNCGTREGGRVDARADEHTAIETAVEDLQNGKSITKVSCRLFERPRSGSYMCAPNAVRV